MNRSLAACFVLLSSPSWAGCRLSTADCTVIAREIANEEIARIEDERHFGWSLPSYERGRALIERHFARKAARYPHISVAIGNEWARMELCATLASHNAEHPEAPHEDPQCR